VLSTAVLCLYVIALRDGKHSIYNWIGHILCRDCLLKHVTEEKTRRGGRRRKKLLNKPMEKKKTLELKEQALDSILRRARLGRGSGSVARERERVQNE